MKNQSNNEDGESRIFIIYKKHDYIQHFFSWNEPLPVLINGNIVVKGE